MTSMSFDSIVDSELATRVQTLKRSRFGHGTEVRAIVLGMQVTVVLMRTPSLAYVLCHRSNTGGFWDLCTSQLFLLPSPKSTVNLYFSAALVYSPTTL